MSSARVAKRYARALLELAAEQGHLEDWGAELERLARIVASPELARALTSPELQQAQRVEAMTKIAERLELSFPLRSFAAVLARHGRIDAAEAISEAYQSLLDERLGRARGQLSFASQPSDDEVARVVAGLEGLVGKKVLVTVKVNPSLLGGVVAEIGGKIYDASLETRLQEAQRRLSE
ncbi:MAG TPA: ATP synthase F1 subunit delta [Candidatus Binataceae bacterium]|nr:ATP synthase F1 subunit delta [Candidatus Binataceae bacterium]